MKAGNGLSPIIKEIMDISAYLWSKGWAEANGGNISVDVTDMFDGTSKMKFSPKASTAFKKGSYPSLKNRLFLISGSGCRFRDIAENPGNGICLIHLSDDGSMFNVIDSDESSSDIRPTSELPTHLLLHEYMRSTGMKERVVLHTHPTELTAISHIRRFWDENVFNRLLHGMLPEVKVINPKGAGLVDYFLPGSEKLAESTLAKISVGFRIIIWQKHGCLAISDSITGAFDMIDVLNKGAQVLLACMNAGEMPEGLSDDELYELKVSFGLEC